jgi:hypothetical protein
MQVGIATNRPPGNDYRWVIAMTPMHKQTKAKTLKPPPTFAHYRSVLYIFSAIGLPSLVVCKSCQSSRHISRHRISFFQMPDGLLREEISHGVCGKGCTCWYRCRQTALQCRRLDIRDKIHTNNGYRDGQQDKSVLFRQFIHLRLCSWSYRW